MTSGFALGPGEGPASGFHGSAVVIKASGEHTLGQLSVMESVYPPGLSVHEHVHAGEDEMFYLLEGELAVFCGEDRWTVTAGSFVFVPRDRPHGFTVTSAGPARALVITGPSRLDAQIAARAEPVPPDLAP
jgi:quercetin dioxygenase-like cupin family protein